ncbi:hypothetical protein ACVOMV_33315 [Mesorhizobium atlanticum]
MSFIHSSSAVVHDLELQFVGVDHFGKRLLAGEQLVAFEVDAVVAHLGRLDAGVIIRLVHCSFSSGHDRAQG